MLGIVVEVAHALRPHETQRVVLDTRLERDLGIDSLARVELLARVERVFGVRLSEVELARIDTPRELLHALESAHTAMPRAVASAVTAPLGEAEQGMEPAGAETLLEALDAHVRRWPQRPHLQLYEDERETPLTYGALAAGARAVARGLQSRGLTPGSAVAIMLPTGLDYFFSFLGVMLAGGVPVPIYPPARPAQIEDHLHRHAAILANCEAAVLITPPQTRMAAWWLRSQVPTLNAVATVAQLRENAGSLVPWQPRAGDIAFLQYTSGTTAAPKGVIVTHAHLLANLRAMGQAIEVKGSDVCVSWLPLYHDMGLIGTWLGCLYYGARLIIMSPLAFIARPESWLHAMHRHRATLSVSPNFGYALCLRRVDEHDIEGLDLSSLRCLFNGAEAVNPDVLEHFLERYARYGLRREAMMPVYGLAECVVGLTFPPLDRGPRIDRIQRTPFEHEGRALPAAAGDAGALRFVDCGVPLPGHETRVVGRDGRELPERREGRIQFRGPSAVSGYYRNPDATRRLFDGDWRESGDLGYIVDGAIYVTGRIKDMIIRAGRNIYPDELERAVGELPGVRKGCVAVFGSQDPRAGTERLVVLAETRATQDAELAALRGCINDAVTGIIGSTADEVILAPPHAVLKTSSGKIRRAANRELYEQGRIGESPLWQQRLHLALDALVPGLRRAKRRLADTLYAAYAWVLTALTAPFAWLVIMLLPGIDRRRACARRVLRAVLWMARIPLTVHGRARIPAGACVLVSNHTSYVDSLVLAAALPVSFGFVAYFPRSATLRLLLRRLDTEFVERAETEKAIEGARRIARAVAAGRTMLFFPEGTFRRMPGLLPFRLGAFLAAAEAGVPVVAVTLQGTRSILRPDSWFPRHGTVCVRIGTPVVARNSSWQEVLSLRDRVRTQMLANGGGPDLGAERITFDIRPTAHPVAKDKK